MWPPVACKCAALCLLDLANLDIGVTASRDILDSQVAARLDQDAEFALV